MTSKEIENRLIEFAISVTGVVTKFNTNNLIVHLNAQATRSATSSALNYGEAQSASSKKDFVHKLSIVMKELRETMINLKIILRLNPDADKITFNKIIEEGDQLLAIFYKSIQTTKQNMR